MVLHFTDRPLSSLKKAALYSLTVGVCLLIIKFIAYALTGSAAILSDAAESIVNVLTASFALYSIKVASKPADECHPYGHGKIEFFSAALEGGSIIVAAVWILYRSLQELIMGPVLHQLDIGLMLVAFAAAINAILGWHLIKTGKKEKSLTLEADGKHILTDVVTSVAVVAGLLIVYFTRWLIVDSIIAILVALNIIYAGLKLLRVSASGMMDASSPQDEVLIRQILVEPTFHDICGYHKLRHRLSGNTHFVDFHLIFPKKFVIEAAHAIATAVEAKIAASLGDASVMAHIEPCRKVDCPNCSNRKSIIS
ncbi:MAG: cation transporter [Deltaproteobacteria bacterium]|nr:cation transporter [Deltaproteobacteria bacterium]